MASALSHAVVAMALGKIYSPQPMPWRFWGLSVLCSLLPDADVIGFAAGIAYGNMLGHRGLSHSLLFAFCLGYGIVWCFFRDRTRFSRAWWSLVLHFTAVTASHGILDAMTNGGLGIAFFAPFDPARYFFAWRPVRVSPISVTAFFSKWGVDIVLSEMLYIWFPTALLLALCTLGRYFAAPRS